MFAPVLNPATIRGKRHIAPVNWASNTVVVNDGGRPTTK